VKGMSIWEETNWYAVQTKLYQENLTAIAIAKLDVAVFLPEIKREQSVCGAWRLMTKPLFPGYFFARFCPLLSLNAVRYALGVVRVLGTRRFPIPLDAEVITSLQARVQPDGFIKLELRKMQPGDRISIEQGPFAGWIGSVERECDDGKRVLILLDAVEKARLRIDKRWLAELEIG